MLLQGRGKISRLCQSADERRFTDATGADDADEFIHNSPLADARHCYGASCDRKNEAILQWEPIECLW